MFFLIFIAGKTIYKIGFLVFNAIKNICMFIYRVIVAILKFILKTLFRIQRFIRRLFCPKKKNTDDEDQDLKENVDNIS